MLFTLWGFAVTWRIAAIAGFVLALMIVHAIPYWRIVQRAGFGGAWSLLRYVPFMGLILLWVFAFVPWPALDARKS